MSEEKTLQQEVEGPAQASKEDIAEMMDEIKLEEVEVEIKKVKKEAFDIQRGAEAIDKETLALYDEFDEFLKVKADITPDTGVKKVIPTGIDVLDASLGGGFPVGALSMVVGNPGSGKSMLVIQAIGNAQKIYPGCLASFLDSEEATTSQRLANLGVRYPRIKPYIDITVEKVFKYLETMCLFKETKGINDIPSILCWDSIANTLSLKEREAEDPNSVIGYKARLLSILVPKYVAKCAKHGIAWLSINQLRDQLSMGPYAPAKELRFLSTGKSLPGGTVLKFNAFTLLEMKAKKALEAEKFGFEGMLFSVTSVKNKFMPPNITVEIIGDYVRGFNNFRTSYHFLVENKRLTTGAWNYLKNMPEKKFRTKDAEILYNENKEFKAAFDDAVKETIQVEIYDKYNQVIED